MLRMTASAVVLCALILAAFVALEGCGVDPWILPCGPDYPCDNGSQCRDNECWPACDAQKPCPTEDIQGNPATLVCYEGFCYLPADVPDAGTTSDAGSDGSSAMCSGPCTPLPEGWSPMPAFWIGPTASFPAYDPPELGSRVFKGQADLDAPPAECDVCSCSESAGKCTDLPSSIEVRAALCGQPSSSISFGGPTNWNGSCTNANAIFADAKCPMFSSTLCAQSIEVGPLGAPVDESCTPHVEPLPMAKFRLYGVTWKTSAVGYDVPGCDLGESCMPSISGLPSGYRACIYKHGEQDCPAEWGSDRHVVYEVSADKLGYVDDRGCSACECGAPMGSACTAQFRVFEDAACTKLIFDNPIASLGEQCTNVLPPGKAIGSKSITSLAYLAGSCEVVGGKPIGGAVPDAEQAVTFCCPSQEV